jgi:hypothetical protein
LSLPDRANAVLTCSWPSARTFTQKCPRSRIRGHVVEVRAGEKDTSGGSRDSELNDWQVNPAGPSSVMVVITTMPEAKWPSTVRRCEGAIGAASVCGRSLMPAEVRQRRVDPISAGSHAISVGRKSVAVTHSAARRRRPADSPGASTASSVYL